MKQITLGVLALACLLPSLGYGSSFKVGYSAVDITPYEFESRPVKKKNPNYMWRDSFYDTGVDQKYDFQEAGAFGEDQQPGIAGLDDDQNGTVDDCEAQSCPEYGFAGSDDVTDPSGDNYHRKKNPKGTEGDKKYQKLHLAGFNPYYPPFMPNRFATGVHDPIWSRAIALEDSSGSVLILVSTDLPGLTWKHINPVRRRIELEFGIPARNIIITSTHNHAAPDASGYWVGVKRDHNQPYTNFLRLRMEESVALAIQNMRAAKMKAVTTSHVACKDAKTGELKKEPDCNISLIRSGKLAGKAQEGPFDDVVMQNDLRDPVQRNTSITALQFVRADNNNPIVTLVNWHNHPDSLKGDNLLVSSDYPHYLRHYVETHLGGGSIFFTGTLGNQIGISGAEVPLWDEGMKPVYNENGQRVFVFDGAFNRIRSIGYEIGAEVVAALTKADQWEDNPTIAVKTQALDTQITNALHQLATRSVWKYDVDRKDATHWYFPRCFTRYGCVRSDVSVGSIGDVKFVTAPGEVDPAYFFGRTEIHADYGKRGKMTFGAMPSIQKAMGGKHQLFFGQAQNYLSYLIHHTDNVGWWNFGHPIHYEEFVTTDKNLGDDVGNKILAMLDSEERYSKRKIYPKASATTDKIEMAQASASPDLEMDEESGLENDEGNVPMTDGVRFLLDHFEEALHNRDHR